MTFSTYYDSTDTGLGGVTNTAGSLVAFMDKVLRDGYNAKTLTSMTAVGTLVTAVLATHGYRDLQFVTISGASPANYNGTWQIIPGSSTTGTFQFNTAAAPGGAATGTIACIVAPLAGWTSPFSSGTALRTYRAGSGNQLYCYIDDTGTTAARMTGYEKMVEIALTYATNPFPLSTQGNGAVFVSKASGAAVRRTILWGNATTWYLFNDYTGDSANGCLTYFGDQPSYKQGDVWNTVCAGGNSAAGAFEPWLFFGPSNSQAPCQATPGVYIARSYSQLPGSVVTGKTADNRFANFNGGSGIYQPMGGASGTLSYPCPIDGNMWISPVTITENSSGNIFPRLTLAGIMAPLHNRPLTTYTIFTGAGASAGKTYMQINLAGSGSLLAEISNTW